MDLLGGSAVALPPPPLMSLDLGSEASVGRAEGSHECCEREECPGRVLLARWLFSQSESQKPRTSQVELWQPSQASGTYSIYKSIVAPPDAGTIVPQCRMTGRLSRRTKEGAERCPPSSLCRPDGKTASSFPGKPDQETPRDQSSTSHAR